MAAKKEGKKWYGIHAYFNAVALRSKLQIVVNKCFWPSLPNRCVWQGGGSPPKPKPAKATLQFQASTLLHNTFAEKHKQIELAGKINENNTSLERFVKGFFDSGLNIYFSVLFWSKPTKVK